MATEVNAPQGEEKQLPAKYVGSQVSKKQYKLWIARAKSRNKSNPPKGTLKGERHGEHAAIVSLLDLRRRARRSGKKVD